MTLRKFIFIFMSAAVFALIMTSCKYDDDSDPYYEPEPIVFT